MKLNFAFVHGELPNRDKDVVLNNLPKDWNVHVLKFFEDEIDLRPGIHQEYVFDDEIFSRKLSREEIAGAESWLGHSLFLALQYYCNWWEGYNTNERKLWEYYELMAKMILYSRQFFAKHKINMFSMFVASRLPFVAAGLTAKKMGLKPAIFAEAGLSNSFCLYDYDFNPIFWKDISKEDIRSAKEFFSARYNNGEKRQEAPSVAEKNRKYFSFLNLFLDDTQRLYKRVTKKKKNLLPSYKPVLQNFSERMTLQARKLLVPLFLQKPDFGEKFVFFPIHFDHETHLTWREHFLDQWDLIRKVSDCLPCDTFLYIKPHPNWMCTEVVLSELIEIRRRRNVRIIYPSLNPLQLVKKSRGVVTINSTTGVEAIALGKPLITFGHNFYAREGVSMPIRDMKDLPEAVEKMIYSPEKSFEQGKRDFFLAQYHKHMIPVTPESTYTGRLTDSDGKKIAEEIAGYARWAGESDGCKKE